MPIRIYNLGVMYDEGEGVPEDDKEAVKWYRKAAEQGHAGAQFNLALMYEEGEGVLEDKKEAVKWYFRAVPQGHVGAQLNLGLMFAKGEGTEKDLEWAYMLWNFAAANGNATAKENKEIAAEDMTPAQITAAQELSKEMLKKYPKLLNK